MLVRAHAQLVSALLVAAVAGSGAAGSPIAGDDRRPSVRLIATGGTISNREGGRLTVDELVGLVPNLGEQARLESEQFSNVASSDLSLDQWLTLARRINQVFASDAGLSGIVVTSGTDTLEELAFFLHLAVRDVRPVVVVGSMRNPSTLGYEGGANLLAAVRVAAEPASRDLGVLVVLNDEINSAREVTKTDAHRLDTFESRSYGKLGVVDSDRVVYFRRPTKRHTARSEFDIADLTRLPRVDVLLVYQNAPGDLIRAAVDRGARGIVVAVAGAGATSGSQEEAIRYALARKVAVVASTRTGAGRIAPASGTRLAGDESGDDDPLSSLITAEDLSPIKARILLMLALTRTDDRDEIQRMFLDY